MLIYSTYAIVGLISILSGFKQRINWLKACYVAAMNLGGYCMVIFLKEWSADTMCNMDKANGVSGHFTFYFFHLLTLPLIWRDSTWPDSRESEQNTPAVRKRKNLANGLVHLLYVAYVLIMATTLTRTYLHGYHSLRQCVHGVFMAVAMHLGCLVMLNAIDWPSPARVSESRRVRPSIDLASPDIPLISFGLFTMLSLWLCYIFHGKLPLDVYELGVLVLVWIRILWGP